jgi:hypothetical protein
MAISCHEAKADDDARLKKSTRKITPALQRFITLKDVFLGELQLIMSTVFTVLCSNKDGKMWGNYIQIYEKNEGGA